MRGNSQSARLYVAIELPTTFKSMVGEKHGRLTCLHPVEIRKNRHVLYACICECGAETYVTSSNLKSSHTQSCGCLMIAANSTHGMSGTKIYYVWSQMIDRCHLKTAPNYKWYGERGIRVVKRWHSFANFYADMGDPPPGYWIERKDNDGPYSPRNCCWVPPSAQASNTRRSVRVPHAGRVQTVTEWERELGRRPDSIAKRLRAGWSVEKALST